MPVITKSEIKGNPPAKAASTADAAKAEAESRGAAPAASTTRAAAADEKSAAADRDAETARRRELVVSGEEARSIGESAVERGALARAEAKVSRQSPYPAPLDQPTRITVDKDGAIIDAAAATDGATVLVGAEADAYAAAHGGKKSAEKTADKSAAKRADKSRKGKRATK